jgi:hypothetical protein
MDTMIYGSIVKGKLNISGCNGDMELQSTCGEIYSYTCCCCENLLHEDDAYFVGGERYCEHCYNENYIHCDHCGTATYIEDVITLANDKHYCEHCTDNFTFRCDECESVYPDSVDCYEIVDENKIVCDSCIENFNECDQCSEYNAEDNTLVHAAYDSYVCEECLEDYYLCENCEEYFDEVYEDDVCENCAEYVAKQTEE